MVSKSNNKSSIGRIKSIVSRKMNVLFLVLFFFSFNTYANSKVIIEKYLSEFKIRNNLFFLKGDFFRYGLDENLKPDLTPYKTERVVIINAISEDQEKIQVSGAITDADTEMPLPGVNVVEKGTDNGVTTDFDGEYSIEVSKDAELEVSFVGYESKTIEVESQNEINITLDTETATLDEVVVVGYGTQKKQDVTGSVTSVDVDNLPPSANSNILQSLRGQSAGLNVEGGASAGSEPSYSIRGQNSLSASQSPLIVLDGVIFDGSMSDINEANVESIDVLKGASAAAVYGSRSSNGVIEVTTKRGRSGKPTINFNTSFGVQDYTNNPVQFMNGEQYAERLVDYDYFQDLYNWYGEKPKGPDDKGGKPSHPGYDEETVLGMLKSDDERKNYRDGYDMNWIDEVTRVAPMSKYDLNISGSGKRFNYFTSGSFIDQKGVQIGDRFKKTNLTSRVEGDILKWVTIGLNTSYSHRNNSGLAAPLESARHASPLASKYDENGMYPIRFSGETFMPHPLRFEYADNKNHQRNIFASGYAKVKVPRVPGLTYDFNYSKNYAKSDGKTFYPSTIKEGNADKGKASISNSERTNWIYNHIINYEREFAELHKLDVTLVYTRDETSSNNSQISAEKFSNEILGYNDVSQGEKNNVESGASKEQTLGYMGRLNYGFDDRFLFTGTYRRDGYSGFGAKNKLVNFYALSAAWVLTEEKFMEGSKDWLDLLKLRISNGENGNQGIGAYSSLSKLGTNHYVFGQNKAIGASPTTLGNPNLGWETTVSTNLGLDFAIVNNKISGTFELYSSDTKDVLVSRSLPGATGYNNVQTNIGKVSNKGVEVELESVNFQGEFQWESKFTFSLNRNKIDKLYGDGRNDIGNQWFIGESIGSIYDYNRTGGVWTEEELYNGEILDDFYPGQFRLEDLNGDNKISAGQDRTIIGRTEPNYRFSIRNDLSYNDFTLSFLINSIQGGNGYYLGDNTTLLEATPDFDYAQRYNQPAIRENWTPDNGVDNAPAVYNYPSIESHNYQDRSFIRLQDISLSYKFDENTIDLLDIRNMEVYISGENLYTWTNWEGYDPETENSMMMRRISLGAKVSF